MKNLTDFIKKRRAKVKLTQEELARRTQVGLRFIRELERGKPTVRCDKVNRVLAFFGYTLGPVRAEREDDTTNNDQGTKR